MFSGDTGLRGWRPGFGPLSLRSDQTGHRGLGEKRRESTRTRPQRRRKLTRTACRAGPLALSDAALRPGVSQTGPLRCWHLARQAMLDGLPRLGCRADRTRAARRPASTTRSSETPSRLPTQPPKLGAQTASDPNKARARLSHGCRWHGHDRPGHDYDRARARAPASAPSSAPAPAAELRARPRASAPARPPAPTRWLGCWPAGTDPSAHENRNGDGEGAPRARQLRCAARPGLNVFVGRKGPPLLCI